MKRMKIEIDGMTCPSCEKHVEKELSRFGAKKISVSHVNSCAVFSIDDNTKEEVLKNAIKTVGYKPGKIYSKEEKKGFFGNLLK